MKKRLANAKTRSETGFEYVMSRININTPFGKKMIKEKRPFFPGEESLLEKEFEKLGKIFEFISVYPDKTDELLQIFMEVKDMSFTISRSWKDVLSVVELFEVKSLLLRMDKISRVLTGLSVKIPGDYILIDLEALIKRLDPRNDKMDTFYIYDEFSDELKEARRQKRDIEACVRRQKKKQKEIIKGKYGIDLTPAFDCLVSKTKPEQLKAVREIKELIQVDEDYVSVTFAIKNTGEIDKLLREADAAEKTIEEQELVVREKLSREISGYEKELYLNCAKIGELDIAVSKAIYAKKHDCVIPEISQDHIIEITEGRHLQAEDTLALRGKEYCPVSISLSDGVTCVTGANMGGKTVSLKLAGLIPLLTQNAFFVPAKRVVVGLSNYMQILIGDNQSVDRGLSSFGGEMEALKEILDNGVERSIVLIDEIASGTNPAEGYALTKSLINYLSDKPYISLVTTHFDNVSSGENVKNMQVAGLSGVDFAKLEREIRYANRRERINIIAKYMDYRLCNVTNEKEVPKDALNIAKMLGLNKEIIENAKKYLEGEKK